MRRFSHLRASCHFGNVTQLIEIARYQPRCNATKCIEFSCYWTLIGPSRLFGQTVVRLRFLSKKAPSWLFADSSSRARSFNLLGSRSPPQNEQCPSLRHKAVHFSWRADRRDFLLSPQGRSDSPRGKPSCANRWTLWPGVWIAGLRHPRR
jgi:hypothetical protein